MEEYGGNWLGALFRVCVLCYCVCMWWWPPFLSHSLTLPLQVPLLSSGGSGTGKRESVASTPTSPHTSSPPQSTLSGRALLINSFVFSRSQPLLWSCGWLECFESLTFLLRVWSKSKRYSRFSQVWCYSLNFDL